MIVQYNQDLVFMKDIDIDNIGEFSVEAWNDEGMFWYYTAHTVLGVCYVATSGPRIPDVEILPKSFKQQTYEIKFDEEKILKDITLFLNDTKVKKITNAKLVDRDYAISQFMNLRDYLEEWSDADKMEEVI